jgi:virulence factor
MMRIAMIGLGDIARKAYMPIVATHGDITPLICTRDTEVLSQVQRQYRIAEAYTQLDAVMEARPDLAMIHSSTDSHYLIARRLLEAGIPVFVDKPVSYHYHETAELVELAAKKQLPLLVGFNRRFAPLYHACLQASRSRPPRQLYYRKNRLNQPARTREFVLDDFIHVLDFVRFCSPAEPADLRIFSHSSEGLLCSLQVQWQCGEALFTAAMNRQHGSNEEQLRYESDNEYWLVDNLASGCHVCDGRQEPLGFCDWTSTLEKRGFVAMIDQVVEVVRSGEDGDNYHDNYSHDNYSDILATHKLCEDVIEAVANGS